MRRFIILFLTTLTFAGTAPAQNQKGSSQDKGDYELDLKKPKNVVNALFYAAQTEDYKILYCLCDPLGKGDNDTKKLCSLQELKKQIDNYGGSKKNKKRLKAFKKMFGSGRITGEVKFSTYKGTEYAEVPIYINHPKEDRSDEKMKLVKRYGNWYLSSF